MPNNYLYDKAQKKKYPEDTVDTINTLLNKLKPRADLAPVVSTPVTPAVPAAPVVPTAPTNLLTTSAAAPSGIPEQDSLSKYWGQPMGKTNLPLDQFVRLAGIAASAFDPTGPGGRMGKDLATIGAEAYEERAKREYETPNRLLQQRLLKAEIAKAEREPAPDALKLFLEGQHDKGFTDDAKNIEKFKRLGLATKEGLVSVYKTFYKSKKAAGLSDEAIDIAWLKRQKDLAKIKEKADKTLVKVRRNGKTVYVPRSEAVGEEAPVPGEVLTSKQLADVESTLLLNADNPAMVAQADLFNAKSNVPYVYLPTGEVSATILGKDIPGTGDYNITKFQLPVVNSKQLTSKDVRGKVLSVNEEGNLVIGNIEEERRNAKEAIDSGEYDAEKIKTHFKALTGQDYY